MVNDLSQLHTMLCLVARGAHLAERPNKRTDTVDLTRNNTYEKFATALNEALHGKFDYHEDIDKREIVRMLDSLMVQRMNVIGRGGLLENQKGKAGARITRTLRLAWERSDGRDFDGSEAEWKNGRREKVLKADMIRRGILPPEEEPAEGKPALSLRSR